MTKIAVIHGDITSMNVYAIVNAANAGLRGGGGVDGAIHRAGGPEIMKECREIINRIGLLPTGKAVITTAGNMSAGKIIHTVGPIYDPQQSEKMDRLLALCYKSCFIIAEEYGIKSIAFPNISTGAYGFPKLRAASVVFQSLQEYLKLGSLFEKILYVCFDEENYRIYQHLMKDRQV
jgi:O-acetyl-ADP-ribose deacetylase (regulator of RNase III)